MTTNPNTTADAIHCVQTFIDPRTYATDDLEIAGWTMTHNTDDLCRVEVDTRPHGRIILTAQRAEITVDHYGNHDIISRYGYRNPSHFHPDEIAASIRILGSL